MFIERVSINKNKPCKGGMFIESSGHIKVSQLQAGIPSTDLSHIHKNRL